MLIKQDASLICSPSEKVHEADAKLKADASALLGRLVGPHVHVCSKRPHYYILHSSCTLRRSANP